MARIRTIKPEFFKSLTLRKLDKLTRLAFIGLWTYVDDNGVGIDEEKLITAELWPLEDNPIEELEGVKSDMIDLAQLGLIRRYSVDGRRLFFITNWDEHQKISHPAKARYFRPMPGRGNPPGEHPRVTAHTPWGLPVDAGDPPESLRKVSVDSTEALPGPENGPLFDPPPPPDDPSPETGLQSEQRAGQEALRKSSGKSPENFRSEQGTGNREQGTGEQGSGHPVTAIPDAITDEPLPLAPLADPPPTAPNFDDFWRPWPRKVKKTDAQRAWDKAVDKNHVDPVAIVDACRAWAERCTATGQDTNFIPYPATWLNGEQWNDDLDAVMPLRRQNTKGHKPYQNPTDPGAYSGGIR